MSNKFSVIAHLRGGIAADGRGDHRYRSSGFPMDTAHRSRRTEHASFVATRYQGTKICTTKDI